MSIIGTMLKNKFAPPPRALPRIDDRLPLGLKIGSLTEIEQTPFLLAKQAGLFVTRPERQAIAAFSKIKYQGFTICRFYFENGVHMLQTALDGAGKIDGDPFLYQLVQEIQPQSKEAWAPWLADPLVPNDFGIVGYKTFDLRDPADLAKVLASYARIWPDESMTPDQVPPEEFKEVLWQQPYENGYFRVKHSVMMYGRVPERPATFPAGIEVPNEWALVSVSEFPSNSCVQIYVGMPIAEGMISFVLS